MIVWKKIIVLVLSFITLIDLNCAQNETILVTTTQPLLLSTTLMNNDTLPMDLNENSTSAEISLNLYETTQVSSSFDNGTTSMSLSFKNESFGANDSSTLQPSDFIISERMNETISNQNKKKMWDFMSDDVRNNGGVIIHFLLLAYVCLALGIVCDIYFLSSLEFISNGLKLPSDIAGATFMAMGTSAPELFTSLIGVFISEDDIGTGTILGSAVFNIIFIPAVCGFAVWKWCSFQPKVSKFAILRDTIFYLITITALLLAMKDNEIDWIESLAMLGLFVIYLIIMYFNAQIGELLINEQTDSDSSKCSSTESSEETPLLNNTNAILVTGGKGDGTMEWNVDSNGVGETRRRYSSTTGEGEPEEDNWIESYRWTKYLMFPVLLAFKLTLPKATKYCFAMTFIMSIVWISLLTYVAVWLVTIIGYTLSIPETISGLTLLAAGTSIPELISSVLVVKRAGLADMALCNSLGSNIFDILVCLGLPWFLKSMVSIINLGSIDPELTMVAIQSEGLPFTTFALLLTVVGLLGTLSMFKWRLGLGVGITCTTIYAIFLIVSK